MTKLFWIGIGIVIGVIGVWLLSKFYCFKNSEEFAKFKESYLSLPFGSQKICNRNVKLKKKKMKNLLCLIGFHDWHFVQTITEDEPLRRICFRCGKKQTMNIELRRWEEDNFAISGPINDKIRKRIENG